MKDWKLVVKNAIIEMAKNADDIVDFKYELRHTFKLSDKDMEELGLPYILEISNCGTTSIHLYADKDDAIETLTNSWKIFGLSHKVVDEYMRPDNMYAYSYTKNDDICFSACVEVL